MGNCSEMEDLDMLFLLLICPTAFWCGAAGDDLLFV